MTRPTSNVTEMMRTPSPDEPETALALVHRGWDHLRLQRPLAAWGSWQRALRIDPENRAAAEALEVLAGADDLPAAARATYRFRAAEGDARRSRWSSGFAGRDLRDLDAAAEAFATLADADPADAAARFNQALCFAWQGRNAEAIAALDLAVRAEAATDPEATLTSWSLAEVLRQGAGAEPWADDLSYSLAIAWDDDEGDPIDRLSRVAPIRPVPTPLDPSTGRPALDARVVEWLDRPLDGPDEAREVSRVRATVVALPGILRLSSPDRPSLEAVEAAIRADLDAIPTLLDRRSTPLPLRLMDAAVFLFRLADPGDAAARRLAVERYYEQVWITRPRLGLSGSEAEGPLTPVEAARFAKGGDAVARAKLAAVLHVRESLSARPRMAALYDGYPFDRLRRRLELAPNDESTIEAADVSCMGRSELEGLDPKSLADDVLAEALLASKAVTDPPVIARLAAEMAARGLLPAETEP